MAKTLSIGQKIEYLGEDKTWHVGKVHAVSKQTQKDQEIVVGYAVDTGKTAREDIGAEPTGKKVKHPVTKKLIPEMKSVKVRQPEQVFVTPEQIRGASKNG